MLTTVFHQVDGIEMTEINQPFPDEVSRNFLSAEIQSEYIRNLGGEDSNGDTACKAYDNRIGDKLNDCPQFEYSQKNEDDTRHQCGDNQPGLSVLLDNAVDNDDERTGRAADLNFTSS